MLARLCACLDVPPSTGLPLSDGPTWHFIGQALLVAALFSLRAASSILMIVIMSIFRKLNSLFLRESKVACLNWSEKIHILNSFNYNDFSLLITLQGFPAAIQSAGISFVTTLPAPMIERAPIVTPLRIILSAPIHTSSSMVIGRCL